MHVIEALGLGDLQAVEQRENHQGRQPLRRRRRVVERAGADRRLQRLAQHGAIAFDVAARNRTADALQVGRDLAPDVATVEIVEAGAGEVIERRRQRALPQGRAGFRRLAVGEERGRKARHVLELGELLCGEASLAARHRIALAGVPDGRREQYVERQLPARGARRLDGQSPAADRARHGERGQRPARRDRLVLAVELGSGACARRTTSLDRTHAAAPFADQPEPVAADMVHVRVDRRDRRRHGNHGFDRVAALGQDRAPGFRRRMMRRRDDAAAMAGAVQVHRGQPAWSADASSPRFASTASTFGSAPRNSR